MDALSGDLRSFYASVRTQKGAYNSKKSMIGIRYVILRHPLNVRDLDIEKNDELKPANLVFQAIWLKQNKWERVR